jgi:hypothetical protein
MRAVTLSHILISFLLGLALGAWLGWVLYGLSHP